MSVSVWEKESVENPLGRGVGADGWRLNLRKIYYPESALQPISVQTGRRDEVAVVPGCRYTPSLGTARRERSAGQVKLRLLHQSARAEPGASQSLDRGNAVSSSPDANASGDL